MPNLSVAQAQNTPDPVLRQYCNYKWENVSSLVNQSNQMVQLYFYIVPIISMPFVATFNGLFIMLVRSRIKRGTVSPIYYLFLINRSASDLVTALAYLLAAVSVYAGATVERFKLAHGFITIANFWLVAFTYASLAGQTFLAISRPLFHRSRVTPKTVGVVLLISWLLSSVFATFATVFGHNLFVQPQVNDTNTRCSLPCQMVMSWIGFGFVTFCYFAAPIVYIAAIAKLRRRRKSSQAVKKSLVQIWRLGVNILLFVVLCMPTVVLFGAVIGAEYTGYREMPDCLTWQDASKRNKLWKLASVAFCVWYARMLIEPFVNVFLDANLRAVLKHIAIS